MSHEPVSESSPGPAASPASNGPANEPPPESDSDLQIHLNAHTAIQRQRLYQFLFSLCLAFGIGVFGFLLLSDESYVGSGFISRIGEGQFLLEKALDLAFGIGVGLTTILASRNLHHIAGIYEDIVQLAGAGQTAAIQRAAATRRKRFRENRENLGGATAAEDAFLPVARRADRITTFQWMRRRDRLKKQHVQLVLWFFTTFLLLVAKWMF